MLASRRLVPVLALGAVALTACSGSPAPAATTILQVQTVTAAPTTTTSAASPSVGAPTPAPTSAPTQPSGAVSSAAPAQRSSTQAAPAAEYSSAVATVQKALRDQGIYSGEVNGVQDAATTAAIKRFQRDHGLTVDGKPGRAFWDAVNGRTDPVEAETDPDPAEYWCTEYYNQWDAAVQAGSKSRAESAHAKAAAMGCNPNTWLPSRAKSTYDPVTTHEKGSRCAMSEVGTRDAAGNVCTQDVEKKPHWN